MGGGGGGKKLMGVKTRSRGTFGAVIKPRSLRFS